MHLCTTTFPLLTLLTTSALAFPTDYLNNILHRKGLFADPALPASTLPPPSGSLKHIVLGVGTQNYTCASPSANPVAIGAIANLYNIRPLLKLAPSFEPTLTPLAAQLSESNGGSLASQLPIAIASLGVHYFRSDGKPVFDLTGANPPARLVAKRVANAAAPADAYDGASGNGAVDWLFLSDLGGGQSFGGVTGVYRVETAAGKAPPTCAGQSASFEVKYATEYWFYGS